MSKEYLEALNDLFDLVTCQESFEKAQKYFDIIEEALKRLESIDNANPSEALECVERLDKMEFHRSIETYVSEIDSDISETQYLGNTDEFYTIKQALLKAQKEHNSTNLLMQELECKDFAELRKYARCGYEKINKKYLKWEDLEKDRTYKVLLNGNQYELRKWYDDYEYHCDYITLQKNPTVGIFIYEWNKETFNDLHLERVE